MVVEAFYWGVLYGASLPLVCWIAWGCRQEAIRKEKELSNRPLLHNYPRK